MKRVEEYGEGMRWDKEGGRITKGYDKMKRVAACGGGEGGGSKITVLANLGR